MRWMCPSCNQWFSHDEMCKLCNESKTVQRKPQKRSRSPAEAPKQKMTSNTSSSWRCFSCGGWCRSSVRCLLCDVGEFDIASETSTSTFNDDTSDASSHNSDTTTSSWSTPVMPQRQLNSEKPSSGCRNIHERDSEASDNNSISDVQTPFIISPTRSDVDLYVSADESTSDHSSGVQTVLNLSPARSDVASADESTSDHSSGVQTVFNISPTRSDDDDFHDSGIQSVRELSAASSDEDDYRDELMNPPVAIIRNPEPIDLEAIVYNVLTVHQCRFCNVSLLEGETSTNCCASGKSILRLADTVLPEDAVHLYDKHQETLRTRSREVNQLCSLSAVGVQSDIATGGITIPYEQRCAEIHGRVFHFRDDPDGSSNHPLLGSLRSYLFAECNESDVPLSQNYSATVVQAALEFRQFLSHHNAFIAEQKQIYGFSENATFLQWLQIDRYRLQLHADEGLQASVPQFLMLYSVNGSLFRRPESYSVMIERDSSVTKAWTQYQVGYERSTYTLLDPSGVSGWFQRFSHTTGMTRFTDAANHELTFFKYLRFKSMQSRIFSRVPRLFEEWLLDGISRHWHIQQEVLLIVLNKHAHVQKNHTVFPEVGFRLATQHQVRQLTTGTAQQSPHNFGKLWKIPEAIRGSPRYVAMSVASGMAQVYSIGGPHLFLTFTANPTWPEVTTLLSRGNKWYDEPLIVCRVFKRKLDKLLSEIRDGEHFGRRKPAYVQYVIEFQKRGIPHAHVLIRLLDFEATDSASVDDIVSCHIPRSCANVCETCSACRLHRTVTNQMQHQCRLGRCYKQADTQKSCKYKFPKPPVEVTHLSTDGYWELRRSAEDSRTVAFNAQILLSYEAHINVEIASSTKSVYYLRKYFSKRPDTVSARLAKVSTVEEQFDIFYRSRCLTSCEASWEILGFPFQYFEPRVEALQLYQEGRRPVVFHPNNPELALQRSLDPRIDKLQLYFKRPLGEEFNDLLWLEYFEVYAVGGGTGPSDLCVPSNQVHRRRQRAVCFVSNVNYANQEHYALFLLLNTYAARNFNDLRSHPSQTFAASATERGLLSNNPTELHISIIHDMVRRHMPYDEIAIYIASLLISETVESWKIFDVHYASMTNCVGICTQDLKLSALKLLHSILHPEGVSLSQVFVNAPAEFLQFVEQAERVFQRCAPLPHASEQTTSVDSQVVLNEEQLHCVESVVNSNDLIYINGFAGSGKTTVLKQIYHELQIKGITVLCCAYTGVAAALLPQGITCHRMFGLPVHEDDICELTLTSTLQGHSLAAARLREADVIIIDEISMLHQHYLSTIDQVLQEVTKGNNKFGGKRIILSGDFCQLPPVVKSKARDTESVTIEASVVSNSLFQNFRVIQLQKSCRFTHNDFSEHLKTVALGNHEDDHISLLPRMTWVQRVDDAIQLRSLQFQAAQERLCICTTNDAAREFNERQMQRFRHVSIRKTSHHTVKNVTRIRNLRVTFAEVENFQKPNTPPHDLDLFIGMPLMIVRNIFPTKGFANGSIVILDSVQVHTITVHATAGAWQGKSIALPRINFQISVGSVTFTRHQFPVVHCFGTTINKTQAQTLPSGIVDCRKQPFNHGQLYVALSRFRDASNIVFVSDSPEMRNVVYKQLLQKARIL